MFVVVVRYYYCVQFFFSEVKMFRHSFILSFVTVFLFHLFEFNLISQNTACIIISNPIFKKQRPNNFSRGGNPWANQLKVKLENQSKSIQNQLKSVENQLKVNWNQLKINWKSNESQLTVNWNQLRISWNQLKVNWNQKSIENNWLNIIQTPVPQMLLA